MHLIESKAKNEDDGCHMAMVHQYLRLSGVKDKRGERHPLCAVQVEQKPRGDEKKGLFVMGEIEVGKVFKHRTTVHLAVPSEDVGFKP